MSRKKLLILIIICIVIIISAIISVPLIIDSQKTATLNLFIVPEQSKILINGEEYKNGNYKFFPGEVEISISKDGFETKNFKTDLKANETTLVYKLLNCPDLSLFCYLNEENRNDFNLIPYITHYADNESETLAFYNNSSIINMLPIHYSAHNDDYSEIYYFTVQYNGIAKNRLHLSVTDFYNNGKPIFETILKESGYDANNYEVDYIEKSPVQISVEKQ